MPYKQAQVAETLTYDKDIRKKDDLARKRLVKFRYIRLVNCTE